MRLLFEEEGGALFDVRQAILGHLQQGGDPSPFDRIFATRLSVNCIDYLEDQFNKGEKAGACIGQIRGDTLFTDLEEIPRLMDFERSRPHKQWWMDLRPMARLLARQGDAIPGDKRRI
jgi:6-phosphofructokinase 1